MVTFVFHSSVGLVSPSFDIIGVSVGRVSHFFDSSMVCMGI